MVPRDRLDDLIDGSRVTVFGGSGFLGRYIVQRLVSVGANVRVAVRNPDNANFLESIDGPGEIVAHRADLRDGADVTAAVVDADAVINLVGVLYERGRQTFTAIHAEGAGRVAEAARAAGAQHLIQVSAIGAAADSPALYARSKAAGEAAVRAAFPAATILRPGIVFGPEDDFFNRFAAMARFSPALPLVGGGATRFQPVYVGDVADAVWRTLVDAECAGQTYELGGPRIYSFREILEIVLRETGRRRLLLPLPFWLADLQAAVLELLPSPMLTRDQVAMLKRDNVVAEDALGLADLGIVATTVEAIVPGYL